MKGVNLKKIGAIVAGAAILASSVAFAGLTYENSALVDDNGQPVAKVVLGSNAAASDGVVAAAIAAKIASASFAKKTLTASAAADATCTTGATGNATGSCAVSNKKVTLEVTVPGATNAGVHAFTGLIGDYVDKLLQNRNNALNDDQYLLSNSETDVDANPFSDGIGGSVYQGDTAMYKVDKTKFSPFADKTITDPNSGNTYTEIQNVWIKGTNQFVSADKAIEFNPELMVYQVKFDEAKHAGIPVCTSESTTNPKYWAWCNNANADYSGKHRVKISFLGSDWIITDMSTGGLTGMNNGDVVKAGGTLNLAKESVYGIINVGDSMSSKDGQLKVRLDDISTLENVKPAVVSFLDANGNVISQDQISPGTTVKKTVGGKTYKVRVYQTAPGYTFGAKWAEMALLEQELELKDNQYVDNNLNKNHWTVRILWKNIDGTAQVVPGDHLSDADALRGVELYKTGSFTTTNNPMMAGDSVNVIEDPVAYKFTYQGVDLQGSEYDNLKYQTSTGTATITMDDGAGGTSQCTLATNTYVRISSAQDDAFQFTSTNNVHYPVTGAVGTAKGKDIYYLLAAPSAGACAAGSVAGDIIMKKSGSDYYYLFDTMTANDRNPVIQYKTAGSTGSVADGGVIRIVNYDNGVNKQGLGTAMAAGVAAATTPAIELVEDIGTAYDAGAVKDDHAIAVHEVVYGLTPSTFTSSGAAPLATDKEVMGTFTQVLTPYAGASFVAGNQVDMSAFGYSAALVGGEYTKGELISPRGSKFVSIGSTSVQYSVANRLGKVNYQFATSEAATAGASTTELVLAEGQSGQVGDVTITAKSITEDVGACTAAGGSASCTVSKDTISAVIMPNNAASVDAVVPYAGFNPKLVVLDKDAAATTTGTLITVGGDVVNSVTADAMAGAGIDFTATPVVVKQVGNKIIVAGATAQDTITAGDQFLAKLQ